MSETLSHSPLGASSCERWWNCPGSIRLSENMPDEQSIYAQEGTVAHKIAEECLRQNVSPDLWQEQEVDGVYVTDEMVHAVQLYINILLADAASTGGELRVEQQFQLDRLRPGMWGTNDALILTENNDLLVYDFKYGKHKPVEVIWNSQLMYYAIGAILFLEQSAGIRTRSVQLCIVQPRCNHPEGVIRRWTIEPFELFEWMGDLIAAVDRTRETDATLRCGDWCQFCRAKPVCPELRDMTQKQAQMVFSALDTNGAHNTVPVPLGQLTLSQMSEILERAPLVEAWLNAIRKHVEDALNRGETINGWKLVEKHTVRRWRDEKQAVGTLIRQFGLKPEDCVRTQLVSPAQAEKIVPRDRKNELNDLWIKPQGKPTLAPAHDRRPAVTPRLAQDVFDAVPASTVAVDQNNA